MLDDHQAAVEALFDACQEDDVGAVEAGCLAVPTPAHRVTDMVGRTLLHWAALSATEDVVCYLLDVALCAVDAHDKNGHTAAHLAVLNPRGPGVAAVLVAAGVAVGVDVRCSLRTTPLAFAVSKPQCPVHLVRVLVDANPDALNATDKLGWTALHHACYRGHVDVASLLFRRGAALDAVDGQGRTLLHASSAAGRLGAAVWVLERHPSSVTACSSSGGTALHEAATHEHLGVAVALVAWHGEGQEWNVDDTISRSVISCLPDIPTRRAWKQALGEVHANARAVRRWLRGVEFAGVEPPVWRTPPTPAGVRLLVAAVASTVPRSQALRVAVLRGRGKPLVASGLLPTPIFASPHLPTIASYL